MIGQYILSGLIQQSSNDCITTNSDGSLTFTETYKGPWTTILNLPTTGGFYKDVARNNTLAGQWAHKFAAPSLPPKKAWYLSQVLTSQLEAGDHGEIRLTWYSASSGGGGDPDAPDLSSVTTNWNCTWAGESKSVLAYCANGGVDLNPDRENASAGNIRMWAEEQDATLKAQNSFQYDGLEYKLTITEVSVGQLYNKDVNPVFHSPVIIKTTSRNIEQLSSINLAGVDTIQTPQGNPFKFEEEWKFIYLGAEVSYIQKSYYSKALSAEKTYYELEMKETWSGHKNPREEFYGGDAWKIGEL